MQKIHFISQIQTYYHNVGDWNISPLNYYYDFFKDYNIVVHSLYGHALDWDTIERDDIIIFGGGGILGKNVEKNSKFVNNLFEICNNVIGWGIGVSRTTPVDKTKIDFDKFKLIAFRDYNNPLNLPYVPCVSCKLPQLAMTLPSKREVGIVHHGGNKVSGLSFESVTNRDSTEAFIKFIASSDAIVTSSYHGALWAMWMGKKVVCANHEWSRKFEYYQYKPEFVSVDNINDNSVYDALSRAKIYPNIRQEAIDANNRFFLSVKELIENTIPEKGNTDYQKVYEMKRMAKLFAWNTELQKKVKKVDDGIKILEMLEESRFGRFMKKRFLRKIKKQS